MKKIHFIKILLISGFMLVSLNATLPVHAETSATEVSDILTTLHSDCYDKYQPQFAQAKAILPTLTNHTIDLTQLGDLPAELGVSLQELQDLAAEAQKYQGQAQEIEVQYAKQAYHDLAQINIDLIKCYETKLANYPDLLAHVQTLKATAEQQQQTIDQFDFNTLYSKENTTLTTVTVPAHTEKNITLHTYCLDPYRHAPETGEEYFLAASVNDLQDKKLCDVLKNAKDTAFTSTTQMDIWNTANTQPKSNTALATVKQIVASETQTQPATNTWQGVTASPVVPIAMSILGFGGVLVLLVGGFSNLNALSALPLKLRWVAGVLIAAGIGITGIWQWYQQSHSLVITNVENGATISEQNSETVPVPSVSDGTIPLATANTLGLVTVVASAQDSFASLNVKITNTTDTDLKLDPTCAEFIPTVVHIDPNDVTDTNGNVNTAINFNENSNQNTNSLDNTNTDSYDVDPSHQDNISFGSQRLGSGGYTDDEAPTPDEPPEPERTVDIEKLKKVFKDVWEYSRDKYLENPTEANLREAIKDLAQCQAVGCEGGDTGIDELTGPLEKNWEASRDRYAKDPTQENLDQAMRDLAKCQVMGCAGSDVAGEDFGSTWQKNIDQALQNYQADPSAVNRGTLIRATEVGRMLGSNTSQATAALYGQGS